MATTPPKPPAAPQNPAEIAREAFRQLATRRIAPTPQNYQIIYNEVAGINEPARAAPTTATPEASPAQDMLASFAAKLVDTPGELHDFGRRFARAHRAGDWETYGRTLALLVEKHFRKAALSELVAGPEALEPRLLREHLARTLSFAVAALLDGSPALVAEAEALGTAVKTAHGEEALAEVGSRLKQLCYQIDIKSGDMAEQQALLLRLFKLLLQNVHELLDEDAWLRGQVEVVQELIAGPIDTRTL